MTRHSRDWPRAVEAGLVVLAAAHAVYVLACRPTWTVDDAYIVARYARHLAEHGSIAWNLGEPKVEGFTSLLEVGLATFATLVHLSPIRVLAFVHSVAFVGSGGLVLALGRALRSPPFAAGLVAVAHLTTAEHTTHALSGLETELFIALALGLAVAFVHDSILATAVLGVLLTLTRPEGVVAGAAALALLRPPLRRALLWFVVPLAIVEIWRVATFGALVPNTYFAKRGPWNSSHLLDVWTLVRAHYADLVAVAAAGAALGSRQCDRRERRLALLAAIVLVAHAVAYARSEPIMAYARRFAMHDVAWIDALTVVALAIGLRRAPRVLAPVLALALVAVARRGVLADDDEASRRHYYATMMATVVEPTANWVLDNTSSDATVAVYPDAGLLPFRTDRRTIDFGRLNDRTLARDHGGAAAVEYFFARMPDALVVTRPGPNRLYDSGAEAIVHDARFSAYEHAFDRDGAGGTGYSVFLRRPR